MFKSIRTLGLACAIGAATQASAVNVYMMSSGDAPTDTAATAALVAGGHSVTLGAEYLDFDTESLAGQDVVYLQANANWQTGSLDMPAAGQTALDAFVSGGGGLVTNEWVLWKMAQHLSFVSLVPLMAVDPTVLFDSVSSVTFTESTPDAIMNAGLPSSFSMPLTDYAGTRTYFSVLRSGATNFYDMDDGYIGLAGRGYGSGRVVNFATTNGPDQVADPEGALLLSNAMNWAAAVPEPGTLAAVLGGLAFLARGRRKGRSR